MVNLQEILKLSVIERVKMVEAIWDSIQAEANQRDIELNENTKNILNERLEKYNQNPEKTSTWEATRKRIEKEL